MSVGATVRPATTGDVPQLVELNALVQTEHVAAEPDVFKPTPADEVAAWFAAELEASSVRAWVATSGAQVVGYVTALAEARPEHLFCHARSWWEVDQLAVRLGWRRRGVARALLAAVAAEAGRAGVGQLQLSTWSFNTGALPTEEASALVPGEDCAVVLEATGSWHAAYDALCATGAQVKLAHPSHVKAIASARVKTDKIDARILAHLLRTDLVPEAWAPPQRVRELRDLVRLRRRFVSQRTTAKNRVSNLLARRCLRYEGSDLFGRRGRAWPAGLPLDTHARALTSLLLAAIDEADAHVDALTTRLHELLDADPELALLTSCMARPA